MRLFFLLCVPQSLFFIGFENGVRLRLSLFHRYQRRSVAKFVFDEFVAMLVIESIALSFSISPKNQTLRQSPRNVHDHSRQFGFPKLGPIILCPYVTIGLVLIIIVQ
jgi:hypothetical protein